MEIQSAEEEIPTADIDSNLPGDCDDGLNPQSAKRSKSRLLFSSAEMFMKPL